MRCYVNGMLCECDTMWVERYMNGMLCVWDTVWLGHRIHLVHQWGSLRDEPLQSRALVLKWISNRRCKCSGVCPRIASIAVVLCHSHVMYNSGRFWAICIRRWHGGECGEMYIYIYIVYCLFKSSHFYFHPLKISQWPIVNRNDTGNCCFITTWNNWFELLLHSQKSH